MNRAEAEEAYATFQAIFSVPESGCFDALPPWRKPPATCARCELPPSCRITFDGEFLCDAHADARKDELTDTYGISCSVRPRTPWDYWLRSFYWRLVHWLIYKGGPFSPFMIRRAWCQSGPASKLYRID